jgi:hypothetical protein
MIYDAVLHLHHLIVSARAGVVSAGWTWNSACQQVKATSGGGNGQKQRFHFNVTSVRKALG